MKSSLLKILAISVIASNLLASDCKMQNQDANMTKSCAMKENKNQDGNMTKSCSTKDFRKACPIKKDAKYVLNVISNFTLSDEQEIKVTEISKKYQKSKTTLMTNNHKNRVNIAEYYTKDGFDQAKYISESAKVKVDMYNLDAQFYSDLFSILDDKQKEQFLTEIKK